jgi:Phage major capsid protein E
MAGNLYDRTTLLEVLRVQKSLPKFWLSTYFGRSINFETEDIAFDKVWTDDRKLAPFVLPTVQGQATGHEGYETLAFKPAYIKPKDPVDTEVPFERVAGEALGVGSLSNEQRFNARVAEIMRRHNVMIDNREEWMAAQAIINGSVIVKGEKYPEVTVDFRRHASLTGTLTGAARWDQSTGTPLTDLKAMKLNVYNRSGARIKRHVFGQSAWDYLVARVDLRTMMQTQIDGYGTRVSMMADGFEGYEYMGTIAGLDGAGAIECWVNTAKYIDPDDGTEKYMQDQDTVVGVSEMVQGIRCYGAIRDKGARFQALSRFPKMWDEEDPSVTYLMTQSAPLMVPKQPNATFSLKVA